MTNKKEILCLKSPYGYNAGIGVKFCYKGNIDDIVNKKLFARILLGFGCYRFAIDKIYNCLKYSNEYTCFLQTTWFMNRRFDLELIMKIFNIELEVFFYESDRIKIESERNYHNAQKDRLKNKKSIDIVKEYLALYKRHYYKTYKKHCF